MSVAALVQNPDQHGVPRGPPDDMHFTVAVLEGVADQVHKDRDQS